MFQNSVGFDFSLNFSAATGRMRWVTKMDRENAQSQKVVFNLAIRSR